MTPIWNTLEPKVERLPDVPGQVCPTTLSNHIPVLSNYFYLVACFHKFKFQSVYISNFK